MLFTVRLHVYSSVKLLQELAGKNAEMMEEVERVRSELNARIDRRSKEELNNRISALEKELNGQSVQIYCY